MSRRAVVLLLLLIALGVIYVWVERPGPVGRRGFGSVPSRAGSSGSASEEGVLPLAVAELDRESAEFSLGRNPFRYGSPRRTAPAPQPVRRPEPRPQQQSETAEPPAPKPPPIDVAYLGNFGRPGHRIAVFSDAEGVYNVQVGDVLKEKFRLVHIGYESVDLGFVGFPDTPPTRLAAGGQ